MNEKSWCTSIILKGEKHESEAQDAQKDVDTMARELVDEARNLMIGDAGVEEVALANPTVDFGIDGHLYPHAVDSVARHKGYVDHYYIIVGVKEMFFGIEDAGDVAEQCRIEAQCVGHDEIAVGPIVMLLAKGFGIYAVSLNVPDELGLVVLTRSETEKDKEYN